MIDFLWVERPSTVHVIPAGQYFCWQLPRRTSFDIASSYLFSNQGTVDFVHTKSDKWSLYKAPIGESWIHTLAFGSQEKASVFAGQDEVNVRGMPPGDDREFCDINTPVVVWKYPLNFFYDGILKAIAMLIQFRLQ